MQTPKATAWLHSTPFREQAHDEQQAEVERIANRVEISLTEFIQQAGEETNRAQEAIQRGEQGRLARARHAQLLTRREQRQRALTPQDVERIAVLQRRCVASNQTEGIAMRVVIEHGRAQVFGISDKNLGYDIASVDLSCA